MTILEHWRRKVVVLLLAILIAASPLYFSPVGGGQTSSTTGPSVALAHKKCPATRHHHTLKNATGANGSVVVDWWPYKHTQAGQNQLRYYWKKSVAGPFTKDYFAGTKVC